jgi:MFS family permease
MFEGCVASLECMQQTKLSFAQITGFWAAWSGWTLDGMDSFIYALVLSPALSELLPAGFAKTPENVGLAGSILFALFLVGWGLSFIWGPIADRLAAPGAGGNGAGVCSFHWGGGARGKRMAARTVSLTRWYWHRRRVGARRLCAEAWPEDRRKMGAGYLQTGYYFGFSRRGSELPSEPILVGAQCFFAVYLP